ncbi:MAG: response regulator, partial [Bacteroidetes bacterium]|nr:response regulator [Bacteroidota bacterium]
MRLDDAALQASRPVSVLVVEDEAIVAADIRLALLGAGYDVVGPVATGPEAIDLALTQSPDIILMDVKIRGSMDGITAAERILEKIDIPFIFATSFSDQATIDRANRLKPQAVVFKPYDGLEIRAELQLALQRHRMQRKLRDSESRYRHLF